MIEQLSGNWVCWAIICLALYCYHQLFLQYLRLDFGAASFQPGTVQFNSLLINALPLLGLLGTIMGLLDCFTGLAAEGVKGERVTRGIADALLSTQLGLICAIPGWLLQYICSACAENHQQPVTANSAEKA